MSFRQLCPLLTLTACLLAAPLVTADPPATQPATQPSGEEGSSDTLAMLLERLRYAGGDNEEAAADEPEAQDESDAQDAAEAVESAPAEKATTPAELMRHIREQRAAEAARPLVAQIDLSQPLLEQPAGFDLFGGGGIDLRGILARLDTAQRDDDCRAVLLTFYNGGLMSFAQANEIRGKLQDLRRAGKRTFVYADTYDVTSYLVASAATDVVLMDGGELFMPGVAIEPEFYRGALDILGIQPDYVQVGEYKGAEEPYTNYKPSPELAKEMESLVDSLFGHLVKQISGGRSIPKSRVVEAMDRAMTPANQAKRLGFVDHLADADGLRQLMEEELGADPRIEAGYAMSEEETVEDIENPLQLLALFRPKPIDATRPSVALVYAEGTITGGEGGGGGLFGGAGIGSERIRRAMRYAERDDEIKAVVIRIDSPGGSALASEAMYQAVRRVAEKKPVIISVGSIAASGGYYLACAGDTIYSDGSAIVGSIGVVGGKLTLKGLYDKVGVNTALFKRGENAALFSPTQPWDERQKRLVRNWMKSTYDLFIERVEEGRGDRIADVDDIARGRIFLAADAVKLGMVDEIGGIEDAIAEAARRGGLEEEDYDVVIIPEAAVSNPLAGLPFVESPADLAAVRLLPRAVREALTDVVSLSQLLEERPVVLMTPIRVRTR